jgi:murein L,D-transpeptidase YcbB/YkuD
MQLARECRRWVAVGAAISFAIASGPLIPIAYSQENTGYDARSLPEPPAPSTPAKPPEPVTTPKNVEKPADAAQPTNQLPAATEATAAPAPVDVDPIVALVQTKLAERVKERVDRDALVAFYAEAGRTPLWVTAGELSRRARDVIGEISRADEWGLSASSFDLPSPKSAATSQLTLAEAEIKLDVAVLKYARHAHGGRVDPQQTGQTSDQKPSFIPPGAVMYAITTAEKPDAYLRGLHPKHPQFLRLRQALLNMRGSKPGENGRQVALLQGPNLRPGVVHPQISALRHLLGVEAERGREDYYDMKLEAAVRQLQFEHELPPDGVITNSTRAVLNVARARPGPGVLRHGGDANADVHRIILNMERWRWMPVHLGELYVWDNIPEYTSRIVKKGETIHSAKIVVGKPSTETPVFSANMRYVVFQPEWAVPDSIKAQEILPSLRPQHSYYGEGGYNIDILRRHNLRVAYNGQFVDASRINWAQTDIRRITFIQPPGPQNVLGVVKFRFPNRHDVYMHDTPERFLLEMQARAFSHGCMRVENPLRFAEIILGEDKGWSSAQIGALAAGQPNNEIALAHPIPVHVTYFTAVADADGKVRFTGDPYGKDERLASALAGRFVHLNIPPEAPDSQLSEAHRARARTQSPLDIFSGLFGN